MSAKLFFLPYSTATVNGIAQPGAQLFFYQTGTLTKLPIYTTNLLDVQLTNPVVATGAGRFPDIYLDSTQTYRLVVQDKNGAPLDDIDPFIPGELTGLVVGNESTVANDRTELASMIGGTGSNAMAFLSEPGREGMFVWTIGDQSAYVTADTAQGGFVAPAVDTTGASGAWVRKFTGPINARWCGALGDGVTNDAAAIQAAINLSKVLRNTGTYYGYSHGGPPVLIPAARSFYNCGTTTLEIFHSMILEGEGGSGASGDTSTLKWSGAATGIRIHSGVSTGASSFTTDRGYSGAGSIVRNLMLEGAFVATESESHGIHMRAVTTIADVFIDNFAGDGIFADTTSFDGIHNDNVNGANIVRPFIRSCRNGIYLNYNETNAIHITNPQCQANRRYGIWKKDGIGCHIDGGNMSANGQVAGWPTVVSNGGHYYYCLPNQDVGASTNAPSGSATSNTWWGYDAAVLADGAPTATRPAWVSGTTYRSGGSIRIEGGSEYVTFSGTYREIDQAPLQCNGKAVGIGGVMSAADFVGNAYGGHITGDASAIYVNQNIYPNVNNNGIVGHPSTRFAGGNFYTVNAATSVLCIGAGGVGYATGAGAAVTQLTNKSTATPAINKSCGAITMNNAALAGGAKVSFVVTNSTVAATDTVIVSVASGGTANAYRAAVTAISAGVSFTITVENITAGSLSEAPVINFAIIKGVAA